MRQPGWLQTKDVAVIPRFFFPGGPPIPEAVQRSMQAKLDSCFAAHPDGLTIPAVKDLMREVLLAVLLSRGIAGRSHAVAQPCIRCCAAKC